MLSKERFISSFIYSWKKKATISDKNCETSLPSPFIQCWLKIGSLFLVFTASYGFFRLGTTLSQEEGRFWIILSKSNVFFVDFLWKYSEYQLFLSLIVEILLKSFSLFSENSERLLAFNSFSQKTPS